MSINEKKTLSFSYALCEAIHSYVFTGGKISAYREILTLENQALTLLNTKIQIVSLRLQNVILLERPIMNVYRVKSLFVLKFE